MGQILWASVDEVPWTGSPYPRWAEPLPASIGQKSSSKVFYTTGWLPSPSLLMMVEGEWAKWGPSVNSRLLLVGSWYEKAFSVLTLLPTGLSPASIQSGKHLASS